MTTIQTFSNYVAITAAAVTIPGSSDGLHPPGKHLVGIGLFIAERDERGGWRFARRGYAISAGMQECLLLNWVADLFSADVTPIGWNIDHSLVPLLLDAVATAPATVACRFVRGLHAMLGAGPVDMSLGHGGTGAPSLSSIAADMAICAPTWNEAAITGAWATGKLEQFRYDLADEAMALWRMFLRSAGERGVAAEDATNAWFLRRQRMIADARTAVDGRQ